jgi:hypothetical protein
VSVIVDPGGLLDQGDEMMYAGGGIGGSGITYNHLECQGANGCRMSHKEKLQTRRNMEIYRKHWHVRHSRINFGNIDIQVIMYKDRRAKSP